MVRERPDLKQYEGRKLTVIAWLWARTVKSPNPAFADVDVPLASNVHAGDEEGQRRHTSNRRSWGAAYRFTVKVGATANGCGSSEGRDQAAPRSELPVPHVGLADRR